MAASSLVLAVSLRVSGALEPAVVQGLWVAAPLFALIAFGVFNTIGIYRRMWRYTSLADIFMVVQGVTLSICVLLIALLVLGRLDWMPRSIPVIHWLLLVVMMGGARVARRMYCESPRGDPGRPVRSPSRAHRRAAPPGGPWDRVETVLRLLE